MAELEKLATEAIRPMNRICPLCNSRERETLYSYTLTSGTVQTIFSCLECGMKYASGGKPVDYATDPIYSVVGAIGSGSSPHDRLRLKGVVDTLDKHIARDARILDVGCGQGGLLDALRERGFAKLAGLDMGLVCAMETMKRGHTTIRGTVSELPPCKFDLIILSHVLEHIEDIRGFLRDCLNHLSASGKIYIEVPDASRYAKFPLPFLDFNSEHINHFSGSSLFVALQRSGMNGVVKKKNIPLTNGSMYPAIWTLAQRPFSTINLMQFVEQSQAILATAEAKMLTELNGFSDVIVWGAGEYLSHVLPMLRTKRIVQIVDRNSALWGRVIEGVKVESPTAIKDAPIVIAAIVAAPSIKRDIETAGLKNIVITVEAQ